MTQAVAMRQEGAAIMEAVLMAGDLGKLTPQERVIYYQRTCESLGLNPLTRPFEYITLNGKLTLYARRDATDQLRAMRGISVTITARDLLADAGIYVVTARATDSTGRHDESVGAVTVKGLAGEAFANALMKAETKAKRRVTLSIAGLGFLDESEAQGLAPAMNVDVRTGEIMDEVSGWTMAELSALLRGSALAVKDLAPILGAVPTRETLADHIDRWLSENDGKSVASLVGLAAEAAKKAADVYGQPEPTTT